MASLSGLALWIAFPFAYAAKTHARWEYRCGERVFTGSFDDCFNDLLPFEVLAFPITILLVYPFARFAFSMFAPAIDVRSFKWRLAARDGGAAYFCSFQIAAAFGVLWAGFHLATLPFAARYWYLMAYWIIWIGWFLLGGIASSPLSSRPR